MGKFHPSGTSEYFIHRRCKAAVLAILKKSHFPQNARLRASAARRVPGAQPKVSLLSSALPGLPVSAEAP